MYNFSGFLDTFLQLRLLTVLYMSQKLINVEEWLFAEEWFYAVRLPNMVNIHIYMHANMNSFSSGGALQTNKWINIKQMNNEYIFHK